MLLEGERVVVRWWISESGERWRLERKASDAREGEGR